MNERPRRSHSATFKAKVTMAAVRGDKTPAEPELAKQFDDHPSQITEWKNQLEAQSAQVLGSDAKASEPPVDVKVLRAKIGQLCLQSACQRSSAPRTTGVRCVAADEDTISAGLWLAASGHERAFTPS